MTDEIKLRKDAARAERAKALLENEMLQESFTELETEYTKALFLTNVSDAMSREKLFLAVNVLRKVKDHLAQVISNGSLAQRELRDLAQMAEQQKTWAQV